MSNLERNNLEAHVDLCAERYLQLHVSLDRLEQRLNSMHAMLEELRGRTGHNLQRQLERYLTWGGVIITTLVGIVVYVLRSGF